MKRVNISKKLELNKKTIAHLSRDDMAGVNGGEFPVGTSFFLCQTEYNSCHFTDCVNSQCTI